MAGAVARKPKTGSATHELRIETERAAALVASIYEVIAGDEDAKKDAIEGETNLGEAIDAAVARIAQIEGLLLGIKALSDDLAARKARLEKQGDSLRAAILIAMETVGLPSHEGPLATVSLRSTGRRVQIVDEPAIPVQFWKPMPPALDKNKLGIALRAGELVTGAKLDNGGLTINIAKR